VVAVLVGREANDVGLLPGLFLLFVMCDPRMLAHFGDPPDAMSAPTITSHSAHVTYGDCGTPIASHGLPAMSDNTAGACAVFSGAGIARASYNTSGASGAPIASHGPPAMSDNTAGACAVFSAGTARASYADRVRGGPSRANRAPVVTRPASVDQVQAAVRLAAEATSFFALPPYSGAPPPAVSAARAVCGIIPDDTRWHRGRVELGTAGVPLSLACVAHTRVICRPHARPGIAAAAIKRGWAVVSCIRGMRIFAPPSEVAQMEAVAASKVMDEATGRTVVAPLIQHNTAALYDANLLFCDAFVEVNKLAVIIGVPIESLKHVGPGKFLLAPGVPMLPHPLVQRKPNATLPRDTTALLSLACGAAPAPPTQCAPLPPPGTAGAAMPPHAPTPSQADHAVAGPRPSGPLPPPGGSLPSDTMGDAVQQTSPHQSGSTPPRDAPLPSDAATPTRPPPTQDDDMTDAVPTQKSAQPPTRKRAYTVNIKGLTPDCDGAWALASIFEELQIPKSTACTLMPDGSTSVEFARLRRNASMAGSTGGAEWFVYSRAI